MWSLVVVEANQVTNDPTGMLQPLKAVAVHALILDCPGHPLDHPILLRTVGGDEFLRSSECLTTRLSELAGLVLAAHKGLYK